MSRKALVDMLQAYEEGALRVSPDGTLIDAESGHECTPGEMESALAELTEKFRKVIMWAKSAPDYAPADQPATTN